ncbi:hypothetical protein GS682_27515 [Nostoc sp. B(2019)]|nr:hypothetical protein [Nostoc sp. B(2019)]
MEKIEEVVAAFPECVLDENVKDAIPTVGYAYAMIQAKKALRWQLEDLN